jgi:hypothetical protein
MSTNWSFQPDAINLSPAKVHLLVQAGRKTSPPKILDCRIFTTKHLTPWEPP